MSIPPRQYRAVLVVLGFSLAASLVFFQNCGKKPARNSEGVGSSSQPPPLTPDIPGFVGPVDFLRGQAFNYDYVPNKSQMVQTMLDVLGYNSHTGGKAVAITADGLGYVSRKYAGMQADADRTALEGCFAISGGKPCVLLASGYNFNLNKADLASSYTFTLSTPTSLVAEQVPFVDSNARTQLINDYKAAPTPKAIAISLDGAYAWVANTPQFPIASANEARRLALERCEMMAAFTPCTLFAQDAQPVFIPTQINRTPTIDYSRSVMNTNIPGMRDAVFITNMTNDYLPQVTQQNKVGAVYITADGRGGYATNTAAVTADTDARNACEASKITYPCFRYAINQNVQNLASNLVAIAQFSISTHCRAIPRQTCAHHKSMGCPAGSYYTLSNGSVALENCL